MPKLELVFYESLFVEGDLRWKVLAIGSKILQDVLENSRITIENKCTCLIKWWLVADAGKL